MTTAYGLRPLITQDGTSIKHLMRYLTAILLAALISGCSTLFANTPMDVLTYKNPDKQAANQHLIVFLRGIGGSHYSFEEEGLVADVWACGLPFDVACPNAHLGYYGDRNLITRLKEDVIDPARARGCQKIWLVGVSMGGLGALLYLMERPQDIAGIYLIAPFLGTRPFLEEIETAGGVQRWDPGSDKANDDWQRMLWRWMKAAVADQPDKKIYLGYGTGDPYKSGHHLLATLLPPDRVYAIDGGHDYQTFKTLWKMFLENDAKLNN